MKKVDIKSQVNTSFKKTSIKNVNFERAESFVHAEEGNPSIQVDPSERQVFNDEEWDDYNADLLSLLDTEEFNINIGQAANLSTEAKPAILQSSEPNKKHSSLSSITGDQLKKGKLKLKSVVSKPSQKIVRKSLNRELLFDWFGKNLEAYPIEKSLGHFLLTGVTITEIELTGVEQLTDAFFCILLERNVLLPHLERLNLKGCYNITDQSIFCLTEMCCKSSLLSIEISGNRKLTHRSLYYISNAEKKNLSINLAILDKFRAITTNSSLLPAKLCGRNQKAFSFDGCPLISPPADLLYTDKLVLSSRKSFPAKKITTMDTNPSSSKIEVSFDQKNGFYLTNCNGPENLVLSNGGIVVLPYKDTDSTTVSTICVKILSIIGQYPENVFVLVGESPGKFLTEVVSNLIELVQSRQEIMKKDSKSHMDQNFGEQMIYGNYHKDQRIISMLTNGDTAKRAILSTAEIDLPKCLEKATAILCTLYPWHTDDYQSNCVEDLQNFQKMDYKQALSLQELHEQVKNSVRPTITRQMTEQYADLLHARGILLACVSTGCKVVFGKSETAAPILNSLFKEKAKMTFIKSIGTNTQYVTRRYLSNILGKNYHLWLDVLCEYGLIHRHPFDTGEEEKIAYVFYNNLPMEPYKNSLDKIWPQDKLKTDAYVHSTYYTFLCLPSWFFPKCMSQLCEISRSVLKWQKGVVVLQGHVQILLQLMEHEVSLKTATTLPCIVLSLRIPNSHTGQENVKSMFEATVSNLTTFFDSLLIANNIFAFKEYHCKSCNPTENRYKALSQKSGSYHMETHAHLAIACKDTPTVCNKKKGSHPFSGKDYFLGNNKEDSLKYLPDHSIFEPYDTEDFMKSACKCFQCNNCYINGLGCSENTVKGLSTRHCGCDAMSQPTAIPMCKYCGVCENCLEVYRKSHAVVHPVFNKYSEGKKALEYGSTVKLIDEVTFQLFGDKNENKSEYRFNLRTLTGPERQFTFLTKPTALSLKMKWKNRPLKNIPTSEGYLIYESGSVNYSNGNISTAPVPKLGDVLKLQLKLQGFGSELVVTLSDETIAEIAIDSFSVDVSLGTSESHEIVTCSSTPYLVISPKPEVWNVSQNRPAEQECCTSYSTYPERKLSNMWIKMMKFLFKNVRNDFSGSAGALLPPNIKEENLYFPSIVASPELATSPCFDEFELHAMCFSKMSVSPTRNAIVEEDLKMMSNLVHFVNSSGFKYSWPQNTEGLKDIEYIHLAWQNVIMHYHTMDLPPTDRLLPLVKETNLTTRQIADGLQEICRINAVQMFINSCMVKKIPNASSVASSCEKIKEVICTMTEKASPVELHPVNSMMMPGRVLFLCLAHTNSWQVAEELTEIPVESFQSYSQFLMSLKYATNNIVQIPKNFFIQFPKLVKFDAGNNCLEEIPESIGFCKNLMYLDVESNNLNSLPDSLQELPNLCRLCLDDNIMERLPPVVTKLKTITRLLMNNLMLTSLPDNFGDICNLESLYMNGNCLTQLPASFSKLQKLKELSLAGIPWLRNTKNSFISKENFMTYLSDQTLNRWLDNHVEDREKLFEDFDEDSNGILNSHEIGKLNATLFNIFPRFGYKGSEPPNDETASGIPLEIFQLKNLTYLNLQYQGIVHVPSEIKNLENLESFTIGYNPNLLTIAAETSLCPLKRLSLDEVPLLKTPPREIVARGFHVTMAFLGRLLKGSVECTRTKLMLVGLGGAGKTSLIRALTKENCETILTGSEAITDGIDISNWEVKHADKTITYSVWDFAGQSVYYNTHQFFLSNRAVYLILWNVRLGYEHSGLNFWLNSISVHAPKAPIFVIGTHMDQVEKTDLPKEKLMKKYHQLVGFFFVSSFDGRGIPDLKKQLFESTLEQDYMGEKVPEEYLHLESIIKGMKMKDKKDVILYSDLEKMAGETVGLVESQQVLEAVLFLHDLGSIQYFQNDYLKAYVVINPQWIVDVMACIVSVKESLIKEGRLLHSDIAAIWKDYDENMHSWLLRLTEEFDLTFRLENEQCNIVPCLLPETQPKIDWPNINKEEGIYETKMVYTFEYLPMGLFNRGQARLQDYSDEYKIWKRGSLLEKNMHLALVQQEKATELHVIVIGFKPNTLLFHIHEVFESLINESFQGLVYDYKIPCPDCIKEFTKEPNMFFASTIRRAMEMKAPIIQCLQNFHMVPSLQLQSVLAPDTLSDYQVQLDAEIVQMELIQQSLNTDIFISYCVKDNEGDPAKTIRPKQICEDLINAGYSCYFPEGKICHSREGLVPFILNSSIFLVLISKKYAEDPVCCDIFRYAVSTLKKNVFYVACGEDFSFQKSETLGVFLSGIVFVNMINSKKHVYQQKFESLLQDLGRTEESILSNKGMISDCFISYCWANSLEAVKAGTREIPGAVGHGDPRHIKQYLEGKGLNCWMDIDRINVNDQLFSTISKGISNSKVVIVCLSLQYAESLNCCREINFALNLGKPVICAIVGTGNEWKSTELGFQCWKLPSVDFQQPNNNALEQLYDVIEKTWELERGVTQLDSKKSEKANEEISNKSIQEMNELVQRKFLRQVAQFAAKQNISNYPRLFVVDLVPKRGETASQDIGENRTSKKELEKFEYYLYTLCESEKGWHSVANPICMDAEDFENKYLPLCGPFLNKLTPLFKHSREFCLELFNFEFGQTYLQTLSESVQRMNTETKDLETPINSYESSYAQFREYVATVIDKNNERGNLKNCKLHSGKQVWLCEQHISEMKAKVLSEETVASVDKSSANQGTDHMLEYLRTGNQNSILKFKSGARAKKVPKGTATNKSSMDLDHELRRHFSHSNAGFKKSALTAAISEVRRESLTSLDTKSKCADAFERSSEQINDTTELSNKGYEPPTDSASSANLHKDTARKIEEPVGSDGRLVLEENNEKEESKLMKAEKDVGFSTVQLQKRKSSLTERPSSSKSLVKDGKKSQVEQNSLSKDSKDKNFSGKASSKFCTLC